MQIEAPRPMSDRAQKQTMGTRSSGSREPHETQESPMSAIVTPNTKSPAKPHYLVAAVSRRGTRRPGRPGDRRVDDQRRGRPHGARSGSGAWERRERQRGQPRAAISQRLRRLRWSRASTHPIPAIAHFAQAEGLTGLSPASLHQSVNVAPAPPSARSLNAASPELQSVNGSPAARSVTASECRLTGPC